MAACRTRSRIHTGPCLHAHHHIAGPCSPTPSFCDRFPCHHVQHQVDVTSFCMPIHHCRPAMQSGGRSRHAVQPSCSSSWLSARRSASRRRSCATRWVCNDVTVWLLQRQIAPDTAACQAHLSEAWPVGVQKTTNWAGSPARVQSVKCHPVGLPQQPLPLLLGALTRAATGMHPCRTMRSCLHQGTTAAYAC